MIQVRFDEQSRSRLVLIWEDAGIDRTPEADDRTPEADGRAANLLFSILDRGQTSAEVPKRPEPWRAPAAAPRRRKPRVPRVKPH